MQEGGATAVQVDDHVVGAAHARELENACVIWSACLVASLSYPPFVRTSQASRSLKTWYCRRCISCSSSAKSLCNGVG